MTDFVLQDNFTLFLLYRAISVWPYYRMNAKKWHQCNKQWIIRKILQFLKHNFRNRLKLGKCKTKFSTTVASFCLCMCWGICIELFFWVWICFFSNKIEIQIVGDCIFHFSNDKICSPSIWIPICLSKYFHIKKRYLIGYMFSRFKFFKMFLLVYD